MGATLSLVVWGASTERDAPIAATLSCGRPLLKAILCGCCCCCTLMFFVARSRNFHRRAYLIFNFPAVAHAFVFTSISRPGPEGFSLVASFLHSEKCVGTLYIDSKKGGRGTALGARGLLNCIRIRLLRGTFIHENFCFESHTFCSCLCLCVVSVLLSI